MAKGKRKSAKSISGSIFKGLGKIQKHTDKIIDWSKVYEQSAYNPMDLGGLFKRVWGIIKDGARKDKVARDLKSCSKCGFKLRWKVLGESKVCTGCGRVYIVAI